MTLLSPFYPPPLVPTVPAFPVSVYVTYLTSYPCGESVLRVVFSRHQAAVNYAELSTMVAACDKAGVQFMDGK